MDMIRRDLRLHEPNNLSLSINERVMRYRSVISDSLGLPQTISEEAGIELNWREADYKKEWVIERADRPTRKRAAVTLFIPMIIGAIIGAVVGALLVFSKEEDAESTKPAIGIGIFIGLVVGMLFGAKRANQLVDAHPDYRAEKRQRRNELHAQFGRLFVAQVAAFSPHLTDPRFRCRASGEVMLTVWTHTPEDGEPIRLDGRELKRNIRGGREVIISRHRISRDQFQPDLKLQAEIHAQLALAIVDEEKVLKNALTPSDYGFIAPHLTKLKRVWQRARQ